MVERLARLIDPEAWGLPLARGFGELTDRDEARAKAVDCLKALREPPGGEVMDEAARSAKLEAIRRRATGWPL